MSELKSALLCSRFAKYYRDAEGVDYRTLIKAYGIRFDVMVNGKVRSQARMFQSLERRQVGDIPSGRKLWDEKSLSGLLWERALAIHPCGANPS